MSIHAGHRLRVKERFLTHGLDSFRDHEALELLLFFAMKQGNVNPTAHKLMNRFGTFDAVFDAPMDELKKVDGVGEHTAALIKLVIALNRRYMIARTHGDEIINSTAKAGAYLIPRFFGERDEVVYMVCMDAKFKVINCKLLSRGSVNTANINIRKIVENALAFNAMSVIIAHNHISGVALPSNEDQETTRKIYDALQAVDIVLTDHIIVADGDFVSMADNGFFI